MSDPWSRSTDEGAPPPPDGSIEIELDGPGGGSTEPTDAADAVRPNWRKVVALSSLGGVVIGLITAAVILMSGDDDSETEPSRPGGTQSAITAPDTLAPILESTVPPVATAPVISGAPHLPLENPTLPAVSLPSDLLAQFTLDAETIAENTADRVSIEVTTEDGAGPVMTSIERDPTNGRYLVTYDRGPVRRLLVAPDEGLYLMQRSDDDQWQVAGDAESMEMAAEQFEAMLLSPVRAETVEAGVVNADTAVMLDNETVARRYTMTIEAFRIPEWTTGENGPPSPGGGHVFEAYVDERGRLALVQGSVVVDGIRELIAYQFDHDAVVTVDFPEIETSAAGPGARITERP